MNPFEINLPGHFIDPSLNSLLKSLLKERLQILLQSPDVSLDPPQLGDFPLATEGRHEIDGHLVVLCPVHEIRVLVPQLCDTLLGPPAAGHELLYGHWGVLDDPAIDDSLHELPFWGILQDFNVLLADLLLFLGSENLRGLEGRGSDADRESLEGGQGQMQACLNLSG